MALCALRVRSTPQHAPTPHPPTPPPARRQLRPGQAVSAIAGLNALTMKKRLALTLGAGLGAAGAHALAPPTFALPEKLGEWARWMGAHRADDPGWWVLKTGQDAGAGHVLQRVGVRVGGTRTLWG